MTYEELLGDYRLRCIKKIIAFFNELQTNSLSLEALNSPEEIQRFSMDVKSRIQQEIIDVEGELLLLRLQKKNDFYGTIDYTIASLINAANRAKKNDSHPTI